MNRLNIQSEREKPLGKGHSPGEHLLFGATCFSILLVTFLIFATVCLALVKCIIKLWQW